MAGPGSYWLGEEEKKHVFEVLAGGQLARFGNLADPRFAHKVFTLEEEFVKYVGVSYTLATNSGTSALLCCLLALGLKPGDEILMPRLQLCGDVQRAGERRRCRYRAGGCLRDQHQINPTRKSLLLPTGFVTTPASSRKKLCERE
jgi:hypothetical protein